MCRQRRKPRRSSVLDSLPYSQACENNKPYILPVLQEVFDQRAKVLEIASGTGQHACHFAAQLPWLQWQPTELAQNLHYLQPRCNQYAQENLLVPVALDVSEQPWATLVPDAVFTANSLHIMSYAAVEAFFQGLKQGAPDSCVLAIYGPFNYQGKYTSDSNARFDQWLAQQHPQSAIRDFEAIDALANDAAFALERDCEMPANNRLLVWRR